MARVLYLEASPRGDKSYSARLASAFFETYTALHPGDEIDRFKLFEHPVPEFDAEAAHQKMEHIANLIAGGQGLGAEGKWAQVLTEIERLKTADKVVIASPMWNYSIPYRLKQYIDVVVQPGLTFYVNKKGEYRGLVRGKPLQLLLASGSEYQLRFPTANDGTKTDFQRAYLEHIMSVIGFQDIRVVKMQPTEALPKSDVDVIFRAKLDEVRAAAVSF